MIAYDLQCTAGHRFEGWFEDAGTYEEQTTRGLVSCPVCNDPAVSRIPSTFAIKSARPAHPEREKLETLVRKIVDYVEKNFDDVGSNFAKEALKIHYGVAEPRNIRGVSTEKEEKVLQDEGIPFLKVPIPARSDGD